MPPTPALRMPPCSTISMMRAAPAIEAHCVGMPNRLPIIADDEITCDTMLMKMPTRKSTDPTVSALWPYSRLTTSSSVVQPLRRSGPVKNTPNTSAPKPAPMVNHQADRP